MAFGVVACLAEICAVRRFSGTYPEWEWNVKIMMHASPRAALAKSNDMWRDMYVHAGPALGSCTWVGVQEEPVCAVGLHMVSV